ncbi:sensor histidine kinase [Flagellimonas baculiformis]|uniref:sensor histidine kinase n=1 Tax=Flagellimonas baculiformis TaxID=3067310 RepID=UPI00296EC1EA|nr:histidine kinase [Muricauda sp. D6]
MFNEAIVISPKKVRCYVIRKVSAFSFLAFWLMLSLAPMIELNAQNPQMDRKTTEVPYSILKVYNPNLDLRKILDSEYTFTSDESWRFSDLNAIYWIRLDFLNELDTLEKHSSWRLRTPNFSYATLFYIKKGRIAHKPFGQFDKRDERTSIIYPEGVSFKKQELIDQRYLYLKVRVFEGFHSVPSFRYLSEEGNRFYTDYYTNEDLYPIIIDHIYLGACLIFFLSFFIIFSRTKKAEFLFYALYILFSALFLVRVFAPGYRAYYGSLLGYGTILVSQILINLFYVLFAMYFLNTKKKYPKLHVAILVIIVVLVLLILSLIYTQYTSNYFISNWILNVQRGVMTLFGISSMSYLLFKAKDKLAIFLVAGSFIYMSGALMYMFTLTKQYMIIGSTLEIIIFSLGLAYKIKEQYEARLALQQEVSLKEISTLRAQMNPHFIFNSLNSIQHLILNDQKVSALNYLSKFGKIARNVLESSHEAIVTLNEEIEMLSSYLELESLRFDNDFKYVLEIDRDLDPDNVEIPLMLLQPFVENAIIHGLVGKKDGEKMLFLRFRKKIDSYVFEIEDNGVGRHGFMVKHNTKNPLMKSRGIEITEKRLNMLETHPGKKNTIEIIDKYDSKGNPTGTKIIIRIHNP